MCGISGIFLNGSKTNVVKIKAMTDSIAHRGPDGEGQWLNTDSNVALGHRRLSIIDLSDNASQPMYSHDKRYTIVFNGEIYNYLEIKKELTGQGHKFNTSSDTEVLLKLYELKKEECLDYLDGMFAFAIWDELEKTLFCGRDRFGEKPFFYNYVPGKSFVFASEIKALLAYGISDSVNNVMLYNFLQSGFFLSDPNDRSQTFYTDIKKLPQASFLKLNKDLQLTEKKYWKIDPSKQNSKMKYDEAKEEFRRLFFDSVNIRQRSDVPIGSSLSGGLDSSSIVCAIHELNKGSKLDQNTFTARFKDYHRDEGYYVEKVMQKTGVKAHFSWPEESDLVNDLDKLLFHQDEPFPTASIYAQYSVMKKAKEEGVTVLLDGQGADEILAGYEYYIDFYLRSLYKNNRAEYATTFSDVKTLYKHLEFKDLSNEELIVQQTKQASAGSAIKNVLRPIYKSLNKSKYKRIDNRLPEPGFYGKDFLDVFHTNVNYDFYYKNSDLNGYLWHSCTKNNLEDLLRFSDRNSMAHSREVRLPFLSHKLVEFLFTLPDEFKIRKGWTKFILRDSMKDLLPEEVAWRAEKVGYEPPQKKWMASSVIKEKTQEALEQLKREKVLDKNATLTEDKNWAVLVSSVLYK